MSGWFWVGAGGACMLGSFLNNNNSRSTVRQVVVARPACVRLLIALCETLDRLHSYCFSSFKTRLPSIYSPLQLLRVKKTRPSFAPCEGGRVLWRNNFLAHCVSSRRCRGIERQAANIPGVPAASTTNSSTYINSHQK